MSILGGIAGTGLLFGLLWLAFWDLRRRSADPVPAVVMLLLFWPIGAFLWIRARRRHPVTAGNEP